LSSLAHCLLYARFSPRPDAATSESNKNQLADLRAYAKAHHWKIVREYSDEDVSGDRWDRPGLLEAIKALKPGYYLVAYNVERIARDSGILAAVLAHVFAKGASVYTLDGGLVEASNPISRLLITIMGAVAEFQKSMIRKRSAVAVKRKMEAGLVVGYPGNKPLPYGFRWINPDRSVDETGRNVEVDPHAQEIREQMQTWKLQEFTNAKIARLLNQRGETYHGKPWTRHNVYCVLRPGVKRGKRPQRM
jgi:DNA invertase Pin-like site-specific DNA recombinase